MVKNRLFMRSTNNFEDRNGYKEEPANNKKRTMVMDIMPLFVMGYEWIWLVLVAGIVIFGAKKIPQIARALGRSQGEFEKGKIEGIKEAKELANSDDRIKLEKAAESLGIETEGKTDEQIRESINKSLSKAEK